MKIPSLHLPAEFIHCLDLLMMKRKARENCTLLQIGLHRLIRSQVSFKLVAS